MTGQDIIAVAREFLKTPFVHQGRLPGKALDCAGLVVVTAQRLGLEVIDVQDYSRLPNNGALEAMLDIQPSLHGVGRGEAQPGDVLLMKFKKEPTHLGIHAGDNLIHCWQPVGMVCEHRFDEAWQRRVVAVYRFTGVKNG